MTREDAAAYCRLTPAGFDDWVARKLMPPPIVGTKRWDRVALDRAWDRLSGLRVADSPGADFETWLKETGNED